MQTADDDAVFGLVHQRQRETLVAAGVWERIEAHETRSSEVVTRRTLHDRHPSGQLIQIPSNLVNRLEMLTQDGLEVAAIDASGELIDPYSEPADLERLQHHDPKQAQARQDKDDGSQVLGYEVEHAYLPLDRPRVYQSAAETC
jgi:hypothetical protein